MFDIDHWLFGLAQRFLPFLSLEKFDDGKSALLHTTEGLAWAGFFCTFFTSKWVLILSCLAWLAFVLWYELVNDGHAERIFVTGPELFDNMFGEGAYAYAHRDMVADLITKLIGLVIYIPCLFRN